MANFAPDLSVFGNIKTVNDFQRLNEEFALKKQLAQAELQKAQQLDLDKLGQQAFIQASTNGIDSLNPTQKAALNWVDSKQQTTTYNPVTGLVEQKPSLLQRAGIGQTQPTNSAPASALNVGPSFRQAMQAPAAGGGGDFLADVAPVGAGDVAPAMQKNEFDIAFEKELANAAGNPKLQQQLRADYSKKKYEMTDAESKNAGFADRMAESNPIIEAKTKAGLNPASRVASAIPLIGNIVAGSDYRSFNQAQRDFINAQLRRESGAVIADSEFENAAQQYFPQVGDDENVLAQKKANRDAVVNAMKRSAGPAYNAPEIKVPTKTKNNALDIEFKLRKKGYTPEQIKEYKATKGL